MKKIVVIVTLFVSSLSFAQQEIKLDLFDALVFKTVEVSYEYYLGDQSSAGLSVLWNFERRGVDFRYNEDRMITPFFRHYFTNAEVWNMFGEVFLGISSGEKETGTNATGFNYTQYTDGALGVGVGTKYTSGALVIDAHIGIGRNLFSSNSPIIAPRAGVGVGYRF